MPTAIIEKGETGRADRPLTVEGEEGAVDPEDYRACEEKELAEKVNSEVQDPFEGHGWAAVARNYAKVDVFSVYELLNCVRL